MARSIAAVIVGYLVLAVAIMALFAVWFGSSDAQPTGAFMIYSLIYGLMAAIVAGYITALIAGRAEMRHAIALAAVALILGIVSMVMAGGREPLWYQVANLFVVVDGVLTGGFLRRLRRQRRD
jgi:peptidoglycan/LPS O-acetylase OafA/YrhL